MTNTPKTSPQPQQKKTKMTTTTTSQKHNALSLAAYKLAQAYDRDEGIAMQMAFGAALRDLRQFEAQHPEVVEPAPSEAEILALMCGL